MSNIFFCADHHFGHKNILNFKNWDGSSLRPDFKDCEHMDEVMVERHNDVVRPEDRVYFLGDVSMGKRGLEYLSRMRGRKVLIKGNHDKESVNTYMKYFDDIRGSHQFDGIILTHIPIHPQSLGRWGVNVHGHLHSNRVLVDEVLSKEIDTRYFCVSMEHIDYRPISLDELKLRIKSEQALYSST